jgi:hypothetical protein
MASSYLFENGTIIDGTGALARPGAVLVKNEKIAAIGEDAARRAGDATHRHRGAVMPADRRPASLLDDASRRGNFLTAASRHAVAANARKVCAGVTALDPARFRC